MKQEEALNVKQNPATIEPAFKGGKLEDLGQAQAQDLVGSHH